MFCFSGFVHAATLELLSSQPASNATTVSRTDVLTLQFSASLNATSVNASTVTLKSAAGNQPVSLSVSGAAVSVHPKNPLLPWTRYTVNIQSLIGTNGDQLATPIAFTFKTRDAAWQPPQMLHQLAPGQWNAVTRHNVKGVRFILWQQTNASGGDDIWAIRQLPGKPASAATMVASYPYLIRELNVFVDDDGNAMASWVVSRVVNGGTNGELLRLSRFVAGTGSGSGWGSPQAIDNIPIGEDGIEYSGSDLHLAFDHAGNALAIWARFQCCGPHTLRTIITNRYTRMRGWTKATILDNNSAFSGGDIDLQMDDVGNAYAAWFAPLSYPYVPPPTVAHYTVNVGWNTPRVIGPYQSHTTPEELALAVNHRGEALLMWLDFDGLDYAQADSSGNWSAPINIDPSGPQPPLNMALLDDGRAFAVFADGVKQFLPSQKLWTSTHPLFANQSVPQGSTSDAQVVADASGNALVAWTQSSNGIKRIFAKRYLTNYGWLSSTSIDTGNTLGAALEDLFLQPDGSADATWFQNNDTGTTDVVSARFE